MDSTPLESAPSRRTVLRSAAAVTLAAPAATVLAACATADGGSEDTAKGTKSDTNPLGVAEDAALDVVIFKGGYSDDYAKYHQSLYSERYPKATVKHTPTTEIQTELQPRFVAGSPPDVVNNSGAKQMPLGTLVADGQVADLGELFAAPSIDDPAKNVADTLMPGALEVTTFDGKVMALPYVYTVNGFWYSKSLFAKHGWTWPSTWDALLSLAGEMTKAGIAPFAYGGIKAPDYFLTPLFALAVKQGGTEVIEAVDNLEPGAWQSEPMKAAADAIAGLAKAGLFMKGCEGLDHVQAQTAWVKGQAAIYASGSWLENEMKSMTPPGFDMVLGTVPPLSASGKLPATALQAAAGENFLVPAKAANLRGGLEYLRVMLSKQGAARFSELTKAPTVVKGAIGNETFGSTALGSVNQAIEAAGTHLFSWRFRGWYSDLRMAVQAEIANLLAGRVDGAGFLTKIQAKADAIAADSSIKKYKR